jgi:hypothetical protein
MSPQTALLVAQLILGLHIVIAGFIIFGIIAIPLGARFAWAPAYAFWPRLMHLGAMGLVALQKLMGDSCFLSVWESRLVAIAAQAPHATPLFQTVGEHVLYWNLPLWFFAWLYSVLFAFVIGLWFWVPPRKSAASAQGSAARL